MALVISGVSGTVTPAITLVVRPIMDSLDTGLRQTDEETTSEKRMEQQARAGYFVHLRALCRRKVPTSGNRQELLDVGATQHDCLGKF